MTRRPPVPTESGFGLRVQLNPWPMLALCIPAYLLAGWRGVGICVASYLVALGLAVRGVHRLSGQLGAQHAALSQQHRRELANARTEAEDARNDARRARVDLQPARRRSGGAAYGRRV